MLKKLHNFLISLGLKTCLGDLSLFIITSLHIVYIHVYVDDMIMTGFNDVEVSRLLTTLGIEVKVQDLTELNYFMQVQVCKGYLVDLLHFSELETCVLHLHPLIPISISLTTRKQTLYDDVNPTSFRGP